MFFCQLVQHKSISSYARVRGKESCPAACFYRTLIAFLCILKYVLHKNCMTGSERSNKGGKKPAEIFFAFNTFLWLFHPKRNTTEVQHKDAHLTDSPEFKGRRWNHAHKIWANISDSREERWWRWWRMEEELSLSVCSPETRAHLNLIRHAANC